MTEVEVIIRMHQIIDQNQVPKNEALNMSTEDGQELGQCLSLIGAIVTAQKNADEPVWLQRQTGERLFALRFLGEDNFEVAQPA